MATRRDSSGRNKKARVEAVAKEVKKRLDERNEAAAKRYQEDVEAFKAEQAQADNIGDVAITERVDLSNDDRSADSNTQNNIKKDMEEKPMAKPLADFNAEETSNKKLSDLDADLAGDIDLGNIPSTNEGGNVEKSGGSNEDGKPIKEVVTSDTITAAAEQSGLLKSKDTNAKVTRLLKENVFMKQFITATDFGRGFVLSTTKGETKEGQSVKYLGEYRIENLKPGRAKSAVITIPRVLANIFESSKAGSVSGLRKELQKIAEGGGLSPEDLADTVDFAMNYNDLAARIAVLMEGEIAEFGGVDGALSVPVESYSAKNDVETGGSFVRNNKAEANVQVVGTKQHNMYAMTGVPRELLLAIAQRQSISSSDDDSNIKKIQRFKEGKSPLKRVRGGHSPLYTSKNFTPMAQYVTVAPFAGALSQSDAERLSAKAVFQSKNNKHIADLTMKTYDAEQIKSGSNVAAVFDPSIPAGQRFEQLTVAKDYVELDAYGDVKMRKVLRKDDKGNAIKDANGKNVYDSKPVEKATRRLLGRTPRDFFTGKEYTAAEMGEVTFVKYGEESLSKKGTQVSPRAQKNVLSYEGKEVVVDTARGVAGTYGLDDASIDNMRNLGIGEDVIKDAFKKAVTRKATARSITPSGDLDDGILMSLLADGDIQ